MFTYNKVYVAPRIVYELVFGFQQNSTRRDTLNEDHLS